jgi:hypothetical protein
VNSRSNQDNKIDYAELNHIRYGLLSIDNWKNQVSSIVSDEIDKLEIEGSDHKVLKKNIEAQLNILISNINERVKKSNKGSVAGWVKQRFMNLFVSIEEIKKGIPGYADAMLAEMNKPKAKEEVKELLKSKLQVYMDQTFDDQDMTRVNGIIVRMKAANSAEASAKLKAEISRKHNIVDNCGIALMAISVLLFLLPAFSKEPLSPGLYIAMICSLIILLIAGVTTPMIDMEARISKMSFIVLEHPVNFENQVLYFQTKSILDVFWVMITHKELQMKFVGLLMIAFSIVFPVIKMTSSLAYYYDYRGVRKNKWIDFFVLKSGKWSMADVMVVAIFMAYIGFNGIISSQFGKLNTTSEEIVVLTTNGTSLQPGYYLFLAYAVLAMFLSGYLTRKPYSSKQVEL